MCYNKKQENRCLVGEYKCSSWAVEILIGSYQIVFLTYLCCNRTQYIVVAYHSQTISFISCQYVTLVNIFVSCDIFKNILRNVSMVSRTNFNESCWLAFDDNYIQIFTERYFCQYHKHRLSGVLRNTCLDSISIWVGLVAYFFLVYASFLPDPVLEEACSGVNRWEECQNNHGSPRMWVRRPPTRLPPYSWAVPPLSPLQELRVTSTLSKIHTWKSW